MDNPNESLAENEELRAKEDQFIRAQDDYNDQTQEDQRMTRPINSTD